MPPHLYRLEPVAATPTLPPGDYVVASEDASQKPIARFASAEPIPVRELIARLERLALQPTGAQ